MHSARISAAALLLVVACGGSDPPPTAPPTVTTAPVASASAPPPAVASAAPAAAAPVLVIVDTKVESTGPKKGAGTLHADGRAEMDGKTIVTLTPDGKALDAKGEEITRIDANGKVGTKGLVIEADGTVKAPDGQVAMALGADGSVTIMGKPAPIKITVSDPKGRRAAMFMMVVLHSSTTMRSTSGPGCPMVKGSKAGGSPTGCTCEDTNNGKKYELECDSTGKKPCICKTDGKQTATVPAAKDICNDQSVWSKCGFPDHVEEVKPQF